MAGEPRPARRAILAGGVVVLAALVGCVPRTEREVVVYAALDLEFSEPILDSFAEESGVTPRGKYDVESTKTVGLTQAILAERDRPVCDVFWNNEILQTLRLDEAGLLVPLEADVLDRVPANFRAAGGTWVGFAGRARVLIVNTKALPDRTTWPTSIDDLADPVWKGRCGLARPLFGTTATHAAVLFASRGDAAATNFFEAVAGNAETLTGNKQVARAVAGGTLAWGITDTDDAIIEVEAGRPVAIVFPDQGEGRPGTLMLPNTICRIRDAPHPAEAERLVAAVVSARTEATLAAGPSAQISLLSASQGSGADGPPTSRVVPSPPPRWMEVDWATLPGAYERSSVVMGRLFP